LFDSKVTPERWGWLEVVAGRLVFRATPEPERTLLVTEKGRVYRGRNFEPDTGSELWVLPLRELRSATRKGEWVVVEYEHKRSQYDIEPRFRPAQLSASALEAEIRRVAADSALIAAGNGLTLIRWAMLDGQRLLITAVDGRSLWSSHGGPGVRPGPARSLIIELTDPYLVPAPEAPEFRWVGRDIDLPSGRHRLSIAVLNDQNDQNALNDRPHAQCALEFEAAAGRTYELTKGDGNVPALRDVANRAAMAGECLPENDRQVVSTITPDEGLILSIDGWSPWVYLGRDSGIFVDVPARRMRNPLVGPGGVRWIGQKSQKIALPAGPRTVSVFLHRVNGGFLGTEEQTSNGACPIAFVAEDNRQYQVKFETGKKTKGNPFIPWRTWIVDEKGQTVGNCGSDSKRLPVAQ
jgi:hypothetical protein